MVQGDTIEEVAKLFIVSKDILREFNRRDEDTPLKPGQVLLVPAVKRDFSEKTAIPTGPEIPVKYTVIQGDTLKEISMLFIVDQRSLATLNDINVDTPLEPGHILLIPAE